MAMGFVMAVYAKKFTVIVHIRINTFLYHFVRVYPLQVLFITILVLMMLWFFILQ